MMDKLKKYLDRLRKTPDKKVIVNLGEGDRRELSMLTAELGVYDNYCILLRTDFSKAIEFLKNRRYLPTAINEELAVFNHPHNLGGVELSTGLNRANLSYLGEKEETVAQLEGDYNVTAMFHPDERRHASQEMKACVSMIIDVIGFIRKNKIPACFPTSVGWRHEGDISRVIYYNPSRTQR